MKNKIIIILICVFLLTGLGFVLYPFVSNFVYELHVRKVVDDYNQTISAMDEVQKQNEWNKAKQYNLSILETDLQLQDSFTSSTLSHEDYNNILNTDGNGLMGIITIPKINVKLPVLHGDSEDVLYRGIGHMPNTSLPIGGIGNHSVLVGHSGINHATLFSHLTELQVGDTFDIQVLDQKLNYQVVSTKVVTPDDTTDLYPVEGKDLVTLLTCTPIGVNSHRLLVLGERIADGVIQPPTTSIIPTVLMLLLAFVTASLLTVTVLLHKKRKFQNGRKNHES